MILGVQQCIGPYTLLYLLPTEATLRSTMGVSCYRMVHNTALSLFQHFYCGLSPLASRIAMYHPSVGEGNNGGRCVRHRSLWGR